MQASTLDIPLFFLAGVVLGATLCFLSGSFLNFFLFDLIDQLPDDIWWWVLELQV